MNPIEELKINVSSLITVAEQDKELFAPVISFIYQLNHLLLDPEKPKSQSTLKFLADNIETFYAMYRSTGGSLSIPPDLISGSDHTVKEIKKLAEKLDSMDEASFLAFFPEESDSQPIASETSKDTILSSKVFIVHGHDEQMKNQLEIFLNEIGLEPIVLHRKADQGLTLIEKFEKHSDVSYAFILLTPDDIAYSALEESAPDHDRKKEYRARPNVIFEFGYFVGKLGRKRVCCLYKSEVSLPTDISGIVYKKVKENVEEVAFRIFRDLKAAGFDVLLKGD